MRAAALLLLFTLRGVNAQHIVWDRQYPNVYLSGDTGAAVSDAAGNLWAVSVYRDSRRLICIQSDGELAVNAELPKELNPVHPADSVHFQLAVSAKGTIALTASYWHATGKDLWRDGTSFAVVHADGTLGTVRTVEGPGADYREFVALSDDQFLLLGDQSPLTLIRLDAGGQVVWRKALSKNWLISSGAPLPGGAVCVSTADDTRPAVRVLRLDSTGKVRGRVDIAASRSANASTDTNCAVLYDTDPAHRNAEFYLTILDASFRRVRTVPVLDSAIQGGYVAAISLGDQGLFLARFTESGERVWSAVDKTLKSSARVVPISGGGFWLVANSIPLRVVRFR